MTTDRVRKAERQDAAVRELVEAERTAAEKTADSERLKYEAAEIRRRALTAARAAGVPVAELADILKVSVQRVYQMLNDGKR